MARTRRRSSSRAPNSSSKYDESRRAFVGTTPFEKRLQRALHEGEKEKVKKVKENEEKKRGAAAYIVLLLLLLGVLLFSRSITRERTISGAEMQKSLQGKRVVIVGASSGIGSEMALLCADNGARVVLAARSREKLEALADRCIKRGARSAEILIEDFSVPSVGATFVRRVMTLVPSIDYLFLNHAWLHSSDWFSVSISKNTSVAFEELNRMLRVSFLSHAEIATAAMSYMSPNGRIVVTSSGAGRAPVHMQAPYAAAKHAMHGFFGSLRQDLMFHQRSNVSISIAVVGRISTENSDKDLRGQYAHLPSYDAADAGFALVEGAIRRQRTILYPKFQIWQQNLFFALLPSVYDAVVILSAHSHPCTNVTSTVLLLPSCYSEIRSVLRGGRE